MTKLLGLMLLVIPFAYLDYIPMFEGKIFFFGIFAGALSLFVFYEKGVKPLKAKWLYLFCLWPMASALFMPRLITNTHQINDVNYWIWKPVLVSILCAALITVVASEYISVKEFEFFSKMVIYAGLATALMAILQALGLDDFFIKNTLNRDVEFVTQANVTGFMGHPTMYAPFVALCVPFALSAKKYSSAGLMTVSVLVSMSIVAIVALLAGLIAYSRLTMKWVSIDFFLGSQKRVVASSVVIAFLIVLTIAGFIAVGNPIKFVQRESNGRFDVWQKTLNDWKSPSFDGKKYTLTGFGPGSFAYLYQIKNGGRWRQAHNDYLELLYSCGLVGVFLLFKAAQELTARINFRNMNGSVSTVFVSVLILALSAGGTFVMQNGVFLFYACFFIGLLHNDSFLYGGVHEAQ